MNGTKLHHRSGSEGPHYDPYHYDEWEVTRLGRTVTIHSGLANWVEIDYPGFPTVHINEWNVVNGYKDLDTLFEVLTGMHTGQCYRYYYRNYVEDPMGCLSDYE